jgi:hypothetical protein
MRILRKLRLGYFPLPLGEARRIMACLRFPSSLDEIEDLLPRSSPYRQAAPILFPQPAAIKGRPLKRHGGHVARCAVSGLLNGVFGSGKGLHVAAWQAVKVIDRSGETEEGWD